MKFNLKRVIMLKKLLSGLSGLFILASLDKNINTEASLSLARQEAYVKTNEDKRGFSSWSESSSEESSEESSDDELYTDAGLYASIAAAVATYILIGVVCCKTDCMGSCKSNNGDEFNELN